MTDGHDATRKYPESRKADVKGFVVNGAKVTFFERSS